MAADGMGSGFGARYGAALAAGLLLLLGGAFLVLKREPSPSPAPAAAPAAPAPPGTAMPGTAMPAAAARPPSFDLVRVGPQGTAVIAGRAEAGAEVVIRDNGREIARTRADGSGSFVATPDAALPEGGRTLSLESRGGGQGSAGPVVAGEATVAVLVPGRGATEAPVAVLLPQAAPPRVLSAERAPAGTDATRLDTVDYDDAGAMRFTGRAPPGSTLRLYVDNAAVGDAAAGADGRWTLTPGTTVPAGTHALRLDRIDGSGKVLARVELPFQRAALPASGPGDQVVVQPGQTLWRLARAAYGAGTRYVAIYGANRDSIRDPNRIYPGQVFAMPAQPR